MLFGLITYGLLHAFECRSKFIFFLIHTAIMTTALVLAARKTDPRKYDEGVDIVRSICEACLLFCIIYNILKELRHLFKELYQLKRYAYINNYVAMHSCMISNIIEIIF